MTKIYYNCIYKGDNNMNKSKEIKSLTKELEEARNHIKNVEDKLEELKEKSITIEDIREKLFENGYWYEGVNGNIKQCAYRENNIDQSCCLTKNQKIQEQARRDLQNVSSYLNVGEYKEFDDNKWGIYYDHYYKKLNIYNYNNVSSGNIYFNTEKKCKKAIDILGETRIKEALGIFDITSS